MARVEGPFGGDEGGPAGAGVGGELSGGGIQVASAQSEPSQPEMGNRDERFARFRTRVGLAPGGPIGEMARAACDPGQQGGAGAIEFRGGLGEGRRSARHGSYGKLAKTFSVVELRLLAVKRHG